ncbi:hypothetical protein JTB14_013268 [Gonioctena quinquepunctata]|nr:hypothetical protein JTB14_013268 [Gonioctena quinquepunctata]
MNLLTELKVVPKDWHNYLRMSEETYLNLLSLVSPLRRNDTVIRNAITPYERLTAMLRFLATGPLPDTCFCNPNLLVVPLVASH